MIATYDAIDISRVQSISTKMNDTNVRIIK